MLDSPRRVPGVVDLEKELNAPQMEAVRSIHGPLLIIAGAGSGKTRVITCRIAHMLESGIPQHAILALTFTNKAAREMETRVKSLTGKKLQALTVNTFHAFGVKILREEIEVLGYRKNFSIYDETDKIELIKECLRESRIGSGDTNFYALGQLFSNIKTGRFTWASSSGIAGTELNAAACENVYKEYNRSLKIFNSVDFDDLLALPIKLFETHPEIRAKYHNRYRYLMVDEFQDTSLIQYRLLTLIALDDTPDALIKSPANVCVVGDDDQSIYSWRGANYQNLVLFEKDFPALREIKLEQNYRSTTTILEAANGVISHNTRRKEKSLWSNHSGGKPIELYYPENESDEADFIAARISELMMRDALNFDAFGVLLRTNSMTRSIEESFLESNIPYRVSGGQSFFQRKEIKDILAYMKVIANNHDDINLLRSINTPRRGIGKTRIQTVSEYAHKHKTPLWDAMERLCRLPGGVGSPLQQKTRVEIDTFMSLVEDFRERMLGERKGLSEKTRDLVDHIDYWSYLVAEYSKNEKIARWKFANIEYFIKAIENWEKNPDNEDPGLFAWLNRVSLITRDDDGEEKGKVNVMTIHAAKGLEFPVVFIAGAEDGIIPHTRSIEDAEDAGGENGAAGESAAFTGVLEEERRLFYVAITRARDKLYITSCQKRRRLQDVVECAPSPFLAEIPPHLIEAHKSKSPVEDPKEAEDYFALMRKRLAP
ncbi:MAG: UvrD-helicase domain-containing protein [Treponema sp.]|jgi:DNA helicase-2/ATP-dependent DNA helicase PcrA|nr:UvrD-helicase domain-containing protein [Treponema sp.]